MDGSEDQKVNSRDSSWRKNDFNKNKPTTEEMSFHGRNHRRVFGSGRLLISEKPIPPRKQEKQHNRIFPGKSRENFGRSVGFMFLEDTLKKDPEEIILVLTKERQGFVNLLEKELNPDAIILIVRILKKICTSAFSDTKYNILQSSLNGKFISSLQTFIACLPSQDSFQKQKNSYFWKQPNEFWINLLSISEDLLNTIPHFACKALPAVLNSMKLYLPLIEQEHNIQIPEDVKHKVVNLQKIIQEFMKDNKEKKNLNENKQESLDPPDDFRKISVYPSAEEIVGGRGFLRENIIKGAYTNVNHYLDVQFRLLREDFVGPLRDGIANYRNETSTNHLDNVKIHKKVQFLCSETINEFYCLRLQFSAKKKKSNSFENSKRFMFGSLLCFTKDNFKTIFFGKVAQRKVEDLQNGQVLVAFDEKINVEYNNFYLMVECSVYFEPYFHVLTVLKNMTEENFPMERYLIRVNPIIQAPEYLSDIQPDYNIDDCCFNPLIEWPNEIFYNLNESQMVAFKAAITQEITVIQGPPGTGKTYLGLKIAQTLLKNKNCWYHDTPLLVICFTNHALDQFLEGLLPFTREIVRVGGQSRNPNLDRYNLRYKSERDGAVVVQKRKVQNCLTVIKENTEKLKEISYYNSVIDFNHFQIIRDYCNSWFSKAKAEDIIEWLSEGAFQGGFKSRNNLQLLQAEDEFNRIGINDEFVEEEIDDTVDFNAHFLPQIDTTFDLNYVEKSKQSWFLITLNSFRNKIKSYESKLFELQEIKNPSLKQLVQEEKLQIMIYDYKRRFDYIKMQLARGRLAGENVVKPESVNLQRPHTIPYEMRWQLYFYWLNRYKRYISDDLEEYCEDFSGVYKEYEELKQIEDVKTMKRALVVGMTTTSAARLRASLQTLKNPIVIVEEAAEVLEAHIVTSITKHCQHLILIGDHKQLKPNTANYGLDKKYRLGISLFERMLNNNIHCYSLNIQHRMRPEISCLIRPTIYEFLEDHPSVLQRPYINGIDNCIYFIDHNHPEEACEGSSKINEHEVNFLVYLARHLVLNGYEPENITILAAYLGQFFEFRKVLKNHRDILDGLKLAVLDNYQGEESDIILLSLVRNNNENKIGFLSIENRVCVALSRARNGMYIMGNMGQLCSNSKLWCDIKSSLEKQNALGSELPLRCQIHQDQITRVKCENDFYCISEGGCTKKCDMDLTCGHKCTYLCHIKDKSHTFYKCQTECNKLLCDKDESHLCKKRCFEECGPCSYLVERTLNCGHTVNIPCHINPDTYNCQIQVSTVLPCGHKCDKPCYSDPETYRCPHICDIQVQPCGHACMLLCHIRTDPKHLEYSCQKPCTKFMKDCSCHDDEHRCKKLCYQDCDPCTVTVRKKRSCGHFYDVPCNKNVEEVECEKPCKKKLKCGHGCKARCNEVCKPCQQKVTKVAPLCGHNIRIRCFEEPSRKYCTKPCPLKLPCGHNCTNPCNNPCTTVKCVQLVEFSGIEAECGHIVKRVECHMTSNANPKQLLKYCQQKCTETLKCGHTCSGTCGECLQGRIHKRCAHKCGAILVCDHKCNFPCSQACRPCKKQCEYRCEHSKCGKKCGEICTPCRERCSRRCQHRWCTKLCGDICNIPPCTEPCPKLLACGHPCVGFCGDPCPLKCMICDKDYLLEIFFGTESEEARYVLLNDCNHIVENEGMENWLQSNSENVSYKLCPRCKTAIKTTQRYSDYIKRAIKDVAKVKTRINGEQKEIFEKMNDIQRMLKQVTLKAHLLIKYFPQLRQFLQKIQSELKPKKKYKNIDIYEVHSFKAKLELIQDIANICCNEKVHIQSRLELFFPQIELIFKVLFLDIFYITAQEIEDVGLEINRLSRIVEFSYLQKTPQYAYNSTNNQKAKELITSLEEKLFTTKRFVNDTNEYLKACLLQLNDIMKSGLAISDRERKEILQAMGFSKGHWFKCPNGHIYAIGECGGAMQEANCYECGAKIGGTHHTLLSDNSVATEMDGARYGAFSQQANINNYDFLN